MNPFRTWGLLPGGLGLLLLSGCGGSGYRSTNPYGAATTGALNVHLVDGPIAGYQEINLHILRLEIQANGTWTTLASPDRTLNLLSLVGGVEEHLAMGASLPVGHYEQLRLILGGGNTVKLADGSVQPLTVPSGLQTGIKMPLSFDVSAGTTKDVFIDFQADHAIQVVAAGASAKYLLRPTVKAFDKAVTGSVSGVLKDQATGLPLAGVLVLAETLDSAGRPAVARSTVTSATGAYTLDLLPLGATYYVVSLPQVGTAPVLAYGPQASDGFALSVTTPTFTFQGAFTQAPALGGIAGAVTPLATADQSDAVDLLASLATPTMGTHTFLVGGTNAAVGVGTETYAFGNLPAGPYSLVGRRSTLAADGTTTTVVLASVPALVPAAGTVTVNLAF